jgi:hypothetical protein
VITLTVEPLAGIAKSPGVFGVVINLLMGVRGTDGNKVDPVFAVKTP